MNTLYCLEEWRGEQRISPPGDKFTPRGQIHPWGTKFASRGEVKNGPQVGSNEFDICRHFFDLLSFEILDFYIRSFTYTIHSCQIFLGAKNVK
jgi:hypothetical protein